MTPPAARSRTDVQGFSKRLNAWLDALNWPARTRPRLLADKTGLHYNSAVRWLTDDPSPDVDELRVAIGRILGTQPGDIGAITAWLVVGHCAPPWEGGDASSLTVAWQAIWAVSQEREWPRKLSAAEAGQLVAILIGTGAESVTLPHARALYQAAMIKK